MQRRRDVTVTVVGTALFLVAVVIGRLSRTDDDPMGMIWPAAAVGTVWFGLARGTANRVAAVVGVTLATALGGALTRSDEMAGILTAAVNLLQFAIAAHVLDQKVPDPGATGRYDAPWRLRTVRDLWWLAAAAAVSSVPLALLSACYYLAVGHLDSSAEVALTALFLLFRNITAIIAVGAPLILLLARLNGRGVRPTHLAPTAEVAAMHVVGAVTIVCAFFLTEGIPLSFSVLPFVYWAALRRSTLNASGYALLVSIAVVVGTWAGHGPFAGEAARTEMLLAQAYLSVILVVGFATALHRDERDELVRAARRAERDAADQGGMLEAVFATSNYGILVYDREGRLLRRNQRAVDTLRLAQGTSDTVDELRSHSWARDPATGAKFAEADLPYSRARAGESVEDVEMLYTPAEHPEGLVFSTSAQRLPDEADHEWAGGVVVSFVDVSAAHRAAHDLEVAHDLLAGVLDGATEQSIVACDPDGVITLANVGAERLFGYPREELVGQSPKLLHDPEEILTRAKELGVPPGPPVMQTVPLRDGSETRRWTMRRRDGSRIPVMLTVTPILSATGTAKGYISIGIDMTKQLEAESRLAESEQRFRLGFDTAPVAMMMVDLESASIIRVNSAATTFTGRGEAELLTMGGLDLLHPRDVVDVMTSLGGFRDGTLTETRFEREFVHADGSPRWAVLSASLVRPTNAESYLMCHLQDVTDRKLAEQAVAHQALHDALTDLPNRTLFQRRLEEALEDSVHRGGHAGILFIDLDGFKDVNDTGGHRAGDAVLQHVADRLRRCIRGGDTAARLGGDEFALICTSVSSVADLQRVADRALELIEQPISTERGVFTVGASIGARICDATADADLDAEALLHDADEAMYAAKKAGKHRVVVHTTTPRPTSPPLTLRRRA